MKQKVVQSEKQRSLPPKVKNPVVGGKSYAAGKKQRPDAGEKQEPGSQVIKPFADKNEA